MVDVSHHHGFRGAVRGHERRCEQSSRLITLDVVVYPVAQLAMALRASVEGDEAGKMRQGKDEVPIRVRLRQTDRANVDDVLRLTIQTPVGPVALGDLASVERGEGPSVIEREDRETFRQKATAPQQ